MLPPSPISAISPTAPGARLPGMQRQKKSSMIRKRTGSWVSNIASLGNCPIEGEVNGSSDSRHLFEGQPICISGADLGSLEPGVRIAKLAALNMAIREVQLVTVIVARGRKIG